MHETRRGAILARLFLVAVAGTLLPAGSCEDNLGDIDPGPAVFRASVGTANLQALGSSTFPSASADGRYVAFQSSAKNLAIPSSAFTEVFVRDRFLDTVRNATRLSRLGILANIFLSDCLEPSISPNGQYLVFLSRGLLSPTFDTTLPLPQVTPGVQLTTNAYFFDLTQDLTIDPSFWFTPVVGLDRWPDADINYVSIADDARIVFQTRATNIPRTGFPDFATGGNSHVFVWNPFSGTNNGITLISHVMGGPPETPANGQSRQPRISGDGNFVAFASTSTNLTADPTNAKQQIYLSASNGSTMELVSRATGVAGATSDEHCVRPAVNYDGSVVAFQVQDLTVGPSTLLPGVDGWLVARRDRAAVPPQTEHVGTGVFIFTFGGPGEGLATTLSDDGRSVGYLRINAAQTDLEVIVRDMAAGEHKASFTLVPASGVLQDFPVVALSGDGRWIFWSSETEIQVLGDNNNASDIFGYGPMR